MAESISPALLKKCQDLFLKEHEGSSRIRQLVNKVRDGTATLEDSAEYSKLIGKILGSVLGETITYDILPNNILYWNIASDVVKPMLEQNYNLVNAMARDVQEVEYYKSKIGIKVKDPPRNDDKITGILQNITNQELTAEQLKNHLETYSQNYTESVHDDFVRTQAETSSRAGLETTVTRTATNCCKWCASVAGVYNYDDVSDTGNDVWRRHTNCHCKIVYKSEKKTEIVKNYNTGGKRNSSGRKRSGKYRMTDEELDAFNRRQKSREEFVNRMVNERGWSKKRAAIFFSSHMLELGG